MKNKNQTIGGISGIIEAIIYIFAFTFLLAFLQSTIDDSLTDLEKFIFIIENKTIYQIWTLLIYVVFGIVLIPLTIAINENFKNQTIWTKTIPVFGFIWAGLVIACGMIETTGINSVSTLYHSDINSAFTSWKAIEAVSYGIGGGVEIVGGIWVFLISIVGLKQSVFNKFLNYFGLIVGSAGILTIIPVLKDLGAFFGITQIVWFAWIGLIMLRNKE